MRIVVIGGSGVIGSRLVTMLKRDGHEVMAASPIDGEVGRIDIPLAQGVRGA